MRRIRNDLKLFAAFVLCLGIAGACGKSGQAGADRAPDKAGDKAAPAAAAPAAGATYTCTKAGDWCFDYSGDSLVLGEDALKGACGAMSGTFATGTCTKDKALGSCNMGKGQVKTYYPNESNNGDGAKSDCDLHDGKFAAAK